MLIGLVHREDRAILERACDDSQGVTANINLNLRALAPARSRREKGLVWMVGPTATDAERARLRAEFPALASDLVFLENAGGSQVPRSVIARVSDCYANRYVQLGAGYPLSQECTRMVDEAHQFLELYLNAGDGHVIIGSSTSTLLRMLADSYRERLRPGQQIIVAESGHEANIGPWEHLTRGGVELTWWRLDRASQQCPLVELQGMLSERTALVALPHVSNLLGEVVDVRAVSDLAHRHGARVVVDGVAYAPHRALDVQAWDVDWYAFSAYKVYGPHLGVLFGKREAFDELRGPNHFFIAEDDIPYKFELGGVPHEGCAALLGFGDYLKVVSRADFAAAVDRPLITRAWSSLQECEMALQQRLVTYLLTREDVTIMGPKTSDGTRVPTVSFVHACKSSREITAAVDRRGVAIRNGHMYAYRLCEALGLQPDDGVVRISAVHYNTPGEIDKLIEILDSIL